VIHEDIKRSKERRDERSRGMKKKLPLDRRVLRDQIREYLVDAILHSTARSFMPRTIRC
jgi:hypothetical protein